MDDYGDLKQIVTIGGQIMTAALALFATVAGKGVWAPPSGGLPNFTRVFGVVAGAGLVALYVLSKSETSAMTFVIIALVATAIGVFGAIPYLILYSNFCFTCAGDKKVYVKGEQVKPRAQMVLDGELNLPSPYGPLTSTPASQADYFCNYGRRADIIWEEGSQTQPIARLFTGYGLAMVPLVLALAAASIALTQVQLAVTKSATETRIEMPADLLFDFGQNDIKPTAVSALEKAAFILKQQHVTAARIEGHTDSKGTDDFNQGLSERRAAAVYNWLRNNATLSGIKLTPRGYGATKPVASNTKPDGSDDPVGRAKNRRVEIVFEH